MSCDHLSRASAAVTSHSDDYNRELGTNSFSPKLLSVRIFYHSSKSTTGRDIDEQNGILFTTKKTGYHVSKRHECVLLSERMKSGKVFAEKSNYTTFLKGQNYK